MTIRIGTSGFQYPEWKGGFYPDKMPASKMLRYYSERFRSTEINYTFRKIPSRKTMDGWLEATPPGFQFSLKAPQKITHFSKLRDCADAARHFQETVAALGSKLGPVLYQLPPGFKKDVAVLESFLEELPRDACVTFEFRHDSWFDGDVFTALKEHGVALCIAESEALATPLLATAGWGYLRLRREDYTRADIERWSRDLLAQGKAWSDVFIYFKHEETGMGPKLARQMMELTGAA